MKASYFSEYKSFKVREYEMPEVSSGMVMIKNMVCGICGTDVHIYHGEPGSAEVVPPVVLGHEYSGEVVAVGEQVSGIEIGDRVTVDPNIYCGSCEYCRSGKKQLCTKMEAIGVTMDGGFSEYSVVPSAQVFKLNKNISFEQGAMAEPLACCIHGIDLAEIKTADTVCVVGAGAIGLIMTQLAVLAGASKIALCEPNERRRAIGVELGAGIAVNPLEEGSYEKYINYIGSDGADIVIECVGNVSAVDSAFRFAKKGATILLFSVPSVDAKYDINLFEIFKKELTVKGSFVNPDTHQRAVELINSGKIDFSKIITHRYPLEKLVDAINMQMSEESVKVVVTPNE